MWLEEIFADPELALYAITVALFIPVFLLGIIASILVKFTFSKYNKVPVSSGVNAETYARNFLADSGVEGVSFSTIGGALTDNFNPKTKVISLSSAVCGAATVGAIGVACHEAGHAVQHQKKYFFSSARLALVPVVNFASNMIWPIFIIGYIFGLASPYSAVGRGLLIAGLAVMGMTLLFSLVTLPTEFNASRRAYSYLKGHLLPDEAKGVKRVLSAAAMTYVASFLLTSLQFLRLLALVLISLKGDKD